VAFGLVLRKLVLWGMLADFFVLLSGLLGLSAYAVLSRPTGGMGILEFKRFVGRVVVVVGLRCAKPTYGGLLDQGLWFYGFVGLVSGA